ncbi:MAG: coenzyme F420-0:L-glutamate ligase [Candidatus Dormibacteria bacterium]
MSVAAEGITWQSPVEVRGRHYERGAIRTHLVGVKEPILEVLQRYVTPHVRAGDFLVLSEKFVAITQGRVIHRSLVRPGLLAKLIVRGVTPLRDDVGFSDPAKMQVAIYRAGWWRMALAMVVGGVTRLVGRHGDFYRIAGNRVSEIDGFNPHTVKPYDEFAMLGPEDPPRDAQAIEDATGWPVVIVDANNVNVEVLGCSRGVPVTAADARLAVLDNPLGQGEEQTPIVLVRPRSGA